VGTRRRLTAVATAVSAVVLVAAGLLVLVLFQRQVVDNGDDLSRSRATDLARLAADGEAPALLTDIGDDSVGQVIGPDGSVVGAPTAWATPARSPRSAATVTAPSGSTSTAFPTTTRRRTTGPGS
jgi:hypothetical protein